MNNMTVVYVVRHGQSIFNARAKREDIEGITYDGDLGDGLSDLGKSQAKEFSRKMANIKFDAIYSSDLLRTRETAEIINYDKKLPLILTNEIRERSVFDYHRLIGGNDFIKLSNELKSETRDLTEEKKMNYKHSPTMESAKEGAARLLTYVKKVASENEGKTILVVDHGNLMRCLLNFLGYAKYDELPHNTIDNCGYMVLEINKASVSLRETHGITKAEGVLRDF